MRPMPRLSITTAWLVCACILVAVASRRALCTDRNLSLAGGYAIKDLASDKFVPRQIIGIGSPGLSTRTAGSVIPCLPADIAVSE
jgi:hypothetical protein